MKRKPEPEPPCGCTRMERGGRLPTSPVPEAAPAAAPEPPAALVGEGIEVTLCRSCGAGIAWGLTAAGKRIPLNIPADLDRGNVALGDDGAARVLGPADAAAARAAGAQLYLSHFATCPNGAAHRKRDTTG